MRDHRISVYTNGKKRGSKRAVSPDAGLFASDPGAGTRSMARYATHLFVLGVTRGTTSQSRTIAPWIAYEGRAEAKYARTAFVNELSNPVAAQ
jgi:hypothetical protein